MGEDHNEVVQFYKKRIEPFMAIFILAFLVVGVVLLWQDNILKKEIAENCGYETKDYICYCEKNTVDKFRLEQEQLQNSGGIIFNVSVDR
jgi:hypothetical protein